MGMQMHYLGRLAEKAVGQKGSLHEMFDGSQASGTGEPLASLVQDVQKTGRLPDGFKDGWQQESWKFKEKFGGQVIHSGLYFFYAVVAERFAWVTH